MVKVILQTVRGVILFVSAEVLSVLKADPHVRKAAAAFWAIVVAGVVKAVLSGSLDGPTVRAILAAAVVAAGAAYAARNKRAR